MDTLELKIPNHVGIIMDGNGRWAQKRGLSRSLGHSEGSKTLDLLSKYIFEKGVKILSIYAFSTENFKRSSDEVNYLMNLFIQKFKKSLLDYQKLNVKVVFSGRRDPLPQGVLEAMAKIVETTKNNTAGVLNFCINYGGHAEIVDTCQKISQKILEKQLTIEQINEELFASHLYHDLPPVDFMIRTGGEMRISNFMPWQCSYAEFYFPNILFPDFKEKEFEEAISQFNNRDRRFGGITYENQNH